MALNRSEQMARIRCKNTTPERALASALWASGLRYRRHARTLGGRPDFVMAGKLAVFVDGCQWHGCPEHYVRPRTRCEFWNAKLAANVDRDIRQTAALEGDGWRVLRFWEHEVRRDLPQVVRDVQAARANVAVPTNRALRVRMVEVGDEEGTSEQRHLIELRSPGQAHVEHRLRTTSKR